MKEISNVDNGALNEAIKALNGIVDAEGKNVIEKIRFIGVKKEERVEKFATAYEAIAGRPDIESLQFPEVASNFYSDLFADELGGQDPQVTAATAQAAEAPAAASAAEAAPAASPGTATAPAATAAPATKPAGEKKKGGNLPKPKPSKAKADLAAMITEGKWTRKEICDTVHAQNPDKARSTITTYMADSLNPKYSFGLHGEGKVAVVGEDSIVRWKQ